jgi:hypothetical protein
VGNCSCFVIGGSEPNDEIKTKESERKLDKMLEEIKRARKKPTKDSV